MTHIDVVRVACDDAGKQFRNAVAGITPTGWNTKANDQGMTVAEMVGHCCECYVAFEKDLRGEAHEWGTFMTDMSSPETTMALWNELRDKAVNAALVDGSDKAVRAALGYGALHDAYHVGQIVLARLSAEPDWNSYSIYD